VAYSRGTGNPMSGKDMFGLCAKAVDNFGENFPVNPLVLGKR
jgi:hypothetical protein